MLTDATPTAGFPGFDGSAVVGMPLPGARVLPHGGLPFAPSGLRPELRGTGVPAAGAPFCALEQSALERSTPVIPARVRPVDVRTAVVGAPDHTTVLTNSIGTTLGNHSPGRPQS